MVKYKIIDNFLSNPDFIELTNNMLPPGAVNELVKPNQLGWIYVPEQVGCSDGEEYHEPERFTKITNIKPVDTLHQWVFAHIFFFSGYQSRIIHILNKLFNKINPIALNKVHAALTVQQEKIMRSPFHIDYGSEPLKHTSMLTSIFYMNTTNGPTILEDGTEIECRANRLVTFSSGTFHAGVMCTDQQRRIVINLNYFKDVEFS